MNKNKYPKECNQSKFEDYNDWKYRIILDKRDGKISMSWTDICSMLNLNCSSEYIRKIATGIAEYRDYLKSKNQSMLNDIPQSSIDAIDEKEMKLRREKMRMQDQKRELNKLLREWSRAEHIQETISKAIKELPKLTHFVRYNSKSSSKQANKCEAVLMLSDWHAGMVTDNAVNIFNTVILEKRVNKLMESAIKICKQHNVRRIHLFCLGDMVNGLIHVTTRINNEEDVIKQSMFVAEQLCKIIMTISEYVDVDLWWSRGNHDRITANKKESICSESFADIILWYIKARLEGIPVNIHENNIDDEIIVADIMSNKIFAAHGHKDKPARAVEDLSLMLKQFPDLVLLGHYHSCAEREVHGAEIVINGSLCGTDDYAIGLRRSSKPAQKLLILNKNGRECTYNITL